jgi:hypothetical protein
VSETKAALALPAVAAVVALPAVLPKVDTPILGHILFGERLAYLPVTVALGLWAARRGSMAADAVVVAGLTCLWLILAPRGPQWPSYSIPDLFLCLAVACAISQLVISQKRVELSVLATLALSLWVVDSLIMAPWCGAAISWEYSTTTACGSAWGDPYAAVPATLALSGWLWWIRRAAGRE